MYSVVHSPRTIAAQRISLARDFQVPCWLWSAWGTWKRPIFSRPRGSSLVFRYDVLQDSYHLIIAPRRHVRAWSICVSGHRRTGIFMDGDRRPHIVVMGVTGCGKSTIARRVAEMTGGEFLDADDLHPPSNVAKMAAGIPLTDADRAPWLQAVRDWMCTRGAGVVACSALRRQYRDVLRNISAPVAFVHLHGSPTTIRSRMAARRGHFMRPILLDSQLALLEPLGPDEFGIVLDVGAGPDDIARSVVGFARNRAVAR